MWACVVRCATISHHATDVRRRFLFLAASTSAKKEIPFTYTRPVKIQSVLKSGDVDQVKPVDTSQPILKFRLCRNLESIDPTVKKLISIEYAHPKERVRIEKEELLSLVQKHPLDTSSQESRIARLTVDIRYGQKRYLQNKKDIKTKVALKENIDKRNKLLKILRKTDYERFEWLSKLLGVTYQSPPLFYHWTTRKGTIRKMARDHCDKLRKEKIDEYKAKLKSMQEEFLKEKEKTLELIDKEQRELGITKEDLQNK